MAVIASSFRRRYTPLSVRFAADAHAWSPPEKMPPAKSDVVVNVVEVDDEDDQTVHITVESPPAPVHAPADHAYTGSPLRLLLHDLARVVRVAWALPYVVWPLRPAGPLSELAPTLANAWCIAVHAVLAAAQLLFLFGVVPLACLLLPAWACAAVVAACLGANQLACRLLLNGWRGAAVVHSRPSGFTENTGEQWIFVNGVGTGRHWLQNNLDRLALTFRRPVVGIHNKTSGLVFDLIECLVQRTLCYATRDVRATYATLRDTLGRRDIHRVVLVLHSQGGIVGGMALDWLLQEVPRDLLAKLEVYTFGNAANHFHALPLGPVHVEHYAHTTDFVALWGVLHYAAAAPTTTAPTAPTFAGRVFARRSPRGGHQFCQHYMDGMFPLARDATTGAVLGCAETTASESDSSSDSENKFMAASRLWQYRDGRCPDVARHVGDVHMP